MNTPEILTLAQWAKLNPEEQKLYREVWLSKERGQPVEWTTCPAEHMKRFADYQDYHDYLDVDYETRQQFERISPVSLATLKVGDENHRRFYKPADETEFFEDTNRQLPLDRWLKAMKNCGAETRVEPAPPVETVEQAADGAMSWLLERGYLNPYLNHPCDEFYRVSDAMRDFATEHSKALLSSQQREIDRLTARINTQNQHAQLIKNSWLSAAKDLERYKDAIKEYIESCTDMPFNEFVETYELDTLPDTSLLEQAQREIEELKEQLKNR